MIKREKKKKKKIMRVAKLVQFLRSVDTVEVDSLDLILRFFFQMPLKIQYHYFYVFLTSEWKKKLFSVG